LSDELKKFSIKKWFFTRIPASGEQWGKLLDFGWKLLVWLLIINFIIVPIYRKFKKAETSQTIGSNSGTIVTENVNKGDSWSLISLFNWR
jgi:hypothetical protein